MASSCHILILVGLILYGPSIAGCSESSKKPTVSNLLARWESSRSAVPSSDLVFKKGQEAFRIAKTDGNCADYVFAAQMFMSCGDFQSAKEALDEAARLFSNQDGAHFYLSELYYCLAFYDLIERGLYEAKLVPIEKVHVSELEYGHLRLEIEELTGSGRPRKYSDLLSNIGVDEKMQGAIGFLLLWVSRERLEPELRVFLPEAMKKAGKVDSLPIVTWKPDEQTYTILRWARSEMELAGKSDRMAEPPGWILIERDSFENLFKRIAELLGISNNKAPSASTPSDIIEDAEAQFEMGMKYAVGDGVPHDFVEAAKWYLKAADQGHANAELSLGILYSSGSGVPLDYEEAAKWLTKAAEQGIAQAQHNLGFMYQTGRGVPQDYRRALNCYRKAAEQNNPKSQHNLGKMYYQGEGVPQDFEVARRWFTKAAEQNDTKSQNHLGIMYYQGDGVPQDFEVARRWFRLGAEQGHAECQFNMGAIYLNGDGVERDWIEAEKWLRKAAAQGHDRAMHKLSIILRVKNLRKKLDQSEHN
jgi:TPR repeat protein